MRQGDRRQGDREWGDRRGDRGAGDRETGRQETGRQGDREVGRQGDRRWETGDGRRNSRINSEFAGINTQKTSPPLVKIAIV